MADIIEYTDSGVVTLTENEIFALVIDEHLAIDPNWNLDPSTPDGYMAAWMARQLRICVEAVREAWNSKDPAKARDAQLNIIGAITGTTRENGTPTQQAGIAHGTAGTPITAGAIVSDGTYEWTVDADATIDGTGQVSVTITNTTNGAIDPDIGSITEIKTTIGGWTSFENTALLVLGTDKESNTAFRVKRTSAVARPGNNQVDSMIGEIFAVDDVLRVAVYENPTDSASVSTDNPYGLPPHSISCVVQGGTDDDVAKAIYIKKNPGVTLNQVGTPVAVEVASEVHPSNSKEIKFGRPTTVDIIAVIELADPLGNLPSNIEELVQNAIISYASADIIDDVTGFDKTGFDIGEDVPVRRVDTPINYVIGQYKGAYISSSTINSLTTGVVAIDFDEISVWSANNISVTVI